MAPRQQVWEALTDPAVLQACIPGCEALTGSVEKGYRATVKQKIGPVVMAFQGNLRVADPVPLESCTLIGATNGSAASAKGTAELSLTDGEGGTQIEYVVQARINGKLSGIGNRVMDAFAERMTNSVFDNLQLAIEGPIEPVAPADVTEEGGEKKPGWFGRLIGKHA